jgi:hypothetical protein
MASPNLISANLILGKTSGILLSNTNEISVLENPASSGKCLKINTLNLANYGSSTTAVTVNFHNATGLGGSSFAITGNVSIPTASTMNIIDKTSQYYLDENTSIGAQASIGQNIVVTISYEEIS